MKTFAWVYFTSLYLFLWSLQDNIFFRIILQLWSTFYFILQKSFFYDRQSVHLEKIFCIVFFKKNRKFFSQKCSEKLEATERKRRESLVFSWFTFFLPVVYPWWNKPHRLVRLVIKLYLSRTSSRIIISSGVSEKLIWFSRYIYFIFDSNVRTQDKIGGKKLRRKLRNISIGMDGLSIPDVIFRFIWKSSLWW